MADRATIPDRSIDAEYLIAVTERCGRCQLLVEVTYVVLDGKRWWLLPGNHGSLDLANLRVARIEERRRAARVVSDKVCGVACFRVLVTNVRLAVDARHPCRASGG